MIKALVEVELSGDVTYENLKDYRGGTEQFVKMAIQDGAETNGLSAYGTVVKEIIESPQPELDDLDWREIAYEDCEHTKLISNEQSYTSGWWTHYEVVFEFLGKRYTFEYKCHTSPNCADTEFVSGFSKVEAVTESCDNQGSDVITHNGAKYRLVERHANEDELILITKSDDYPEGSVWKVTRSGEDDDGSVDVYPKDEESRQCLISRDEEEGFVDGAYEGYLVLELLDEEEGKAY